MANKKNWLAILVMVLVFGIAVTGCDGGGVDYALNGTWVYYSEWTGKIEEFRFNNGNFEYLYDELLNKKGSYTTSCNIIIMTVTHCHGNFLGINGNDLEKKWYTKAELQALAAGQPNEEMLLESLNNMFTERSGPYLVSGSTFTFEEVIYTRN